MGTLLVDSNFLRNLAPMASKSILLAAGVQSLPSTSLVTMNSAANFSESVSTAFNTATHFATPSGIFIASIITVKEEEGRKGRETPVFETEKLKMRRAFFLYYCSSVTYRDITDDVSGRREKISETSVALW